MEFMKEVENQYELAIVDPPYGIGEDGSKNHTRSKLATAKNYKPYSGNDKEPPTVEFFNKLISISKNQIIWGANHFISRIPFDSSCWIVWDKDNGESDFADCELAYTSFNSSVRYFKWRWAGMLQQNMKNKEERSHPNQKPIALYRWLLQNYAKQGDKIIDTHGGSMTLARACYEEGFDLDIMELDKEYFDKGVLAFKQHVSQQKLF
jgi:site-specific DNA-methyltransferase (adenine-specific)